MGFWSGKRVFITGISGFAGSYLAKELLKEGAEVWGFLRFRADRRVPKNLIERGIHDSVRLLEGDLMDLYSVLTALDEARPEVIFHLAAQSFVHRSFYNALETFQINTLGTANLLEAVRLKAPEAKLVFAGSSEEYGMVYITQKQYEKKPLFPAPTRLPEVPIKETNPLRPLSPYAVSKVHGDHMMRQYFVTYGLRTVVSRAFNHEGAGRGGNFVTSVVTRQVAEMLKGKPKEMVIGNVSAFRDWSHVKDTVRGYMLIAERGEEGQVYNQGSERTNSVLTYILWALEEAEMKPRALRRLSDGSLLLEEPAEVEEAELFGLRFEASKADLALLEGELELRLEDQGLLVETDGEPVKVKFDPARFRPSDVPILLSDATRVKGLGFEARHSLRDIIRDQINYYLTPERGEYL